MFQSFYWRNYVFKIHTSFITLCYAGERNCLTSICVVICSRLSVKVMINQTPAVHQPCCHRGERSLRCFSDLRLLLKWTHRSKNLRGTKGLRKSPRLSPKIWPIDTEGTLMVVGVSLSKKALHFFVLPLLVIISVSQFILKNLKVFLQV